MSLTDLIRNVVRATTLTAALYSCGGKETTVYPCRTSADCNSGSCVEGYCESPNQGNGDCGIDSGRFCTCYEEACPGIIEKLYDQENDEYDLNACNRMWTKEKILDLKHGESALFFFCQLQTGICIDYGESRKLAIAREPDILSCMESYGWVPCGGNCPDDSIFNE